VAIHFDEAEHRYWTERRDEFTSVSQLAKEFFPAFDELGTATRVAVRDQRPVKEVLEAWAAKGQAACDFGTRVHENCENQMKGAGELHQPRDERERRAFRLAFDAVERLRGRYRFVEAEKIVFSERYGVAGTVDLMMLDTPSRVMLLDYKTNREIKTEGFRGEKGKPPVTHLDNANYWHYALAMSLYEKLLRDGGYIGRDVPVTRALVHFPPEADKPEWIELPDLSREAADVLLWHATNGWDEVPF
jgi:ATP-dependent exoDNAse (exonuclease V) beta subunit